MYFTATFLRYATAFEEAYATDDWSRIEPYFTEDAAYQPIAVFGHRVEGRAAIAAAMKRMVDAFDRRFASRRVDLVEGPIERNDTVWLRWAATYTLPGSPELRMVGEEIAEFAGDRIRRLEDRMREDEIRTVAAYMAEHAGKLP